MTLEYAICSHAGFTDHEVLRNTARVQMNSRVNSPNLGRFLSVDPMLEFPTNIGFLTSLKYEYNRVGAASSALAVIQFLP